MQLFRLLFEKLGKRTCSLSHHHTVRYTFCHSQILTFYPFQILLFFCPFFFFFILYPCSMVIEILISVSRNSFAVFIYQAFQKIEELLRGDYGEV